MDGTYFYAVNDNQTGRYAVESMDPTRLMVKYHLYQEQCKRMHHGRYVKQLKCLNRNLAYVIMLDADPNNCDAPENVMVIPYWDGKSIDTVLIDLIPFFQGERALLG